MQSLIDKNGNKATNEVLKQISKDVEISISEIFNMLDIVKIDNCKKV